MSDCFHQFCKKSWYSQMNELMSSMIIDVNSALRATIIFEPSSARFSKTRCKNTVLRAYLDQYKVEDVFRLAKDGMRMSRVYIHRPSRENAMMFVISLGTMVSDVIGHVLKTKGIDTTTDGIAGRWFTLMFKYDRAKDSEYFDGSDVLIDEFLDAVQALGLGPDHLIH